MKFGLRELVLLAVLLAMPVASFFLVFQPQNAAIDRAQGEIEHKERLLDQLRVESSRNDDLRRANEEIQTRIADIEARLPSNKEVDRIIRQVSQVAIGAGLASPAMKNAKPVEAALYWEQPLELESQGDFKGFYRFLIELERLPRITRIPDMKLKRRPGENGRMDIDFTLSIYFQQDGSTP